MYNINLQWNYKIVNITLSLYVGECSKLCTCNIQMDVKCWIIKKAEH